MRVARVDPSGLDARSVGFRLAPRINAAGRLHRADAGVELLLTTDEARADAIAEELDAANAERRSPSSGSCSRPRRRCASSARAPAYVLAGEGWHPGVIGIVASRIVERTHRPAMLIALDARRLAAPARAARSRRSTCSARCTPPRRCWSATAATAPPPGLTIDAARVDALREAFEAHAAAVARAPRTSQPVERVDAVVGGASSASRSPTSSRSSSRSAWATPASTCSSPAPR